MKKFFIIALAFSLMASSVHAATVSLSAPAQALTGKELTVDVLLDPEGESVNSVDIAVSFSPSAYAFSGYADEGATIPIWVARPSETEPGTVTFSGVVPGGLDRMYDPHAPQARAIPLVSLHFLPLSAGSSSFVIRHVTLLRNDGRGTAIGARAEGASVAVKEGDAAEYVADAQPPAPFSIALIESSRFGKTPRLAVFDATDSQSGVERYEVRINRGRFVEATSPYSLPRLPLPYTLTARAVDFAGNYRDAQVTVSGNRPMALVTIALLAAVVIVIYIRRARRRKNPPLA